ncbi:MAG TPA: peptidase U32 [Candidatus Moranbacteria bacterium]|nr:peptidase U32 [Candidatus Moranbacteria bacterium]HAT74838.1 peptidase U32 [Candidatus Moranbacteria bacterium]
MKNKFNKIELLAPAGSLEKLKYAIAYGADAVYCGIPDFSLRVRINHFSEKDLAKAVEYTHKHKKKIYATLNIYAHNRHLEKIKKHILFLKKIKVDGIIASDPGIISLIQKYWSDAEIHLSTQANATNIEAVNFWKKQGIKRIILAREISLSEIKEIKRKTKNIELEYFIHGAMCMSYSGRCILSKWMTDRSANLGDCSQPCRWKYYKIPSSNFQVQSESDILCASVVDDQKRFEMNVEEDKHGTYFFNSYDMNLIEYIDNLMNAGIISLKIEGRAKSAYYLAIVTRAYRAVIDAIENKLSKKEVAKIIKAQKKELDNLVHRGYSIGFLLGCEPEHNFENRNNIAKYQFVGEVEGSEGKFNVLRVHNQVSLGDKLEAIMPEKNIPIEIKRILDYNKKEVNIANGGHKNRYYFEFDQVLEEMSLVRKRVL